MPAALQCMCQAGNAGLCCGGAVSYPEPPHREYSLVRRLQGLLHLDKLLLTPPHGRHMALAARNKYTGMLVPVVKPCCSSSDPAFQGQTIAHFRALSLHAHACLSVVRGQGLHSSSRHTALNLLYTSSKCAHF